MSDFIENNKPDLWLSHFPRPKSTDYKYNRGHAIILAAPKLTGATRLAAEACSRVGAGLVSVIAPEKADIYRKILPADIMVQEDISENLKKVTAVLGGSGGINAEHFECLINNKFKSARIFDAEAISLATQDVSKLDDCCIVTPHDGEFQKAFPDIKGANRQEKALNAAVNSGAHIVLKGPETVIAHPAGRVCINDHASAYLAKAGTGDVLAGLITGLIAQNMPVFEACAAASWIHGESALRFGPGFVAGDIANTLPDILSELLG